MPTREQLIEAIESASYRTENIRGDAYVENYAHCFADSVLALLNGGEWPTDANERDSEVGGKWHQDGPDDAHERWRCSPAMCGWEPSGVGGPS
jgi:hypothetical protein